MYYDIIYFIVGRHIDNPLPWYIFLSPIFLGISGCITLLIIVANWQIFSKAGHHGWEAVIPFYNLYIFCIIVHGKENGWRIIWYFIPLVRYIFILASEYRLGKAFGMDTSFCILSIVFCPITRLILAFGDYPYHMPYHRFSNTK